MWPGGKGPGVATEGMNSPKCKKPKLEEEEKEVHGLSPSKGAKTGITDPDTEERETLPFHIFTSEVLYSDPLTKTIALTGKFDGSTDVGVLFAEKSPLTHSSIQQLLASCKVDKKFQNDVYSQYVLEGKQGSAGEVKVTMVYPATEDHVKKYAVQKLRFVLETPQLYQKVTKPFIEKKSFSLDVCKQFCVYLVIEFSTNTERHRPRGSSWASEVCICDHCTLLRNSFGTFWAWYAIA